MRLLPALFLLLMGCATSGPEPLRPDEAVTERGPDAVTITEGPEEVVPVEPIKPSPEDRITREEPAIEHGPTPEGAAAVAELLRARHAEDLPNAQSLAQHPEAASSLVWLSLHGESAAVRIRATEALGQFPDAGHADHLASLFLADDTHPALRAAALRALAHYDPSIRQRYRAILEQLAKHDDPRVREAAEQARPTP